MKIVGPVTVTFLMLVFLESFKLSFCGRNHNVTCIQSERQALLRFKQHLKDPSNRLSSWTKNGDCCRWDGIICSNVSGHLIELHLGSSRGTRKLGGKLNPALLDLNHLTYLDLSDNDFRQTEIPTWFWNMSSNLSYFNISRNQFQGNIPDLLTMTQPSVLIDLSCNNFTDSLPLLSSNVTAIDFSFNSLSGSMSHFLCHKLNEPMKLEILNLGHNLLSGKIPECWKKWSRLVGIKLCDNNFSGKIPGSMGALTLLQSLHVRNNSVVGEIPSSLRHCGELVTADFGYNQLSGDIPGWIGERLPKLIILSLHSNKFYSAMNSGNNSDDKIFYRTSKGSFFEDILVVMKGRVVNYDTTLKLVKTMDLSDNNLSGEIPEEVTSLAGLQSLNFSHSHLVGRIPYNIGAMTSLECFDLSTNNLSGEIPLTISDLSFLSHLNLSYNKFTGKIPTGTQLQSLNADSFYGTKLFGPPLSESSTDVRFGTGGVLKNREDQHQVDWFFLTVELGFLSGFFGTVFLLMLCKSGRLVHFQYVDETGHSLGRIIRKYIVK
ncbi:hypothetical protein ES319_D11G077600v1 [Gossypium barbadense]|uniref:Leucine-rich repeat-containing N-terminal plant-type domain-containing protein n=1 Tax=Gossypium barbadense TaxID=3634 RepID=A0A5J5P7W7_GOSBA|nr:hypothetical protein ES319_D11G077600v1 [Gossypium barbadense]